MKGGANLRSIGLIGLLALLAGLGPVAPSVAGGGPQASADTTCTIDVDSVDDDDATGACTLRDAIGLANANLGPGTYPNGCTVSASGTDTPITYLIHLPSYTYRLTGAAWEDSGTSGDLDIWSNVTLIGMGAEETVIDADDIDRVFHVDPWGSGAFTVSFSGLTIRNGWVSADGAGIHNGGDGTVTISDCTISGNNAVATDGASGGGIYSAGGVVNVTDSIISENLVASGLGRAASGGGISIADGALNITSSTVQTNTAYVATGLGSRADGGGIFADDSTVNITSTAITGNEATGTPGGSYFGMGGGVFAAGGTLHITSGSTLSGNQAEDDGGGLYALNASVVKVIDSSLSGNAATNGGAIYAGGSWIAVSSGSISTNTATFGGGIYASASRLNVSDGCSLHDNEAGNDGGAVYVDDSSVATVDDSTISGNSADEGGGLYNEGTLTIRNHSFIGVPGAGNKADYHGGGIYNFAGTVVLTDSTVSGNECGGWGGGIHSSSPIGEGALTLNGCTVSGNTAINGGEAGGGGIFLDHSPADLTNTTLSGNTADYGGGIGSHSDEPFTVNLLHCTIGNNLANNSCGGMQLEPLFTVNMANTIIAVNSATEDRPDICGAINSQDYNLIQDTSGATIGGTTAHNIIGQDPQLGPLADNGGATQTRALLAGSPAIDAIPEASCPLPNDQRGVSRPQRSGCDIGAYEADTVQVFLPLLLRDYD